MRSLVRASGADLPFYQFAPLATHPALTHGVFTRHGGVSDEPYASLNVSLTVGDDRARVLENRARIARALGARQAAVRAARQVHGAGWRVIDSVEPAAAGAELEPADILLTQRPGVLLLLKFADCTPLVVWDRRRRWVAVAHAGWRGTAHNVAATVVGALRQVAGSLPGDLWVGIGPAIGRCCYEVSDEVVTALAVTGVDTRAVASAGPRGRPHLDLAEANRLQFAAAGVPPEQIELAHCCTACHTDEFFSHRALGAPAGRFGVAAGVA